MSQKIKVMTFNVRVAVNGDGINYFDNRLPRITELINSECPDVIGFQEANNHMRRCLRRALPDYILVGCGRDADYRGESTAVAFRKDIFEMVNMESFWLSATPSIPGSRYGEDQSQYPRITTAVLLQRKGAEKPFWFINTHLDHQGSVARLLGSIQIMQYISEKDHPCIITGDLNALPDSREIKVFSENEDLGIIDCTSQIKGTFHGFRELDEEGMAKIDYIFTNLPADPSESKLCPDEPVDGVFLSDHRPVCAYVTIE